MRLYYNRTFPTYLEYKNFRIKFYSMDRYYVSKLQILKNTCQPTIKYPANCLQGAK